VSDLEREVLLSVSTDHPGDRSFQGIYRTVLHPQLRQGNRLDLTDEQVGTLWRVINDRTGQFMDAARRGLFRALTAGAGPEALKKAYHGETDQWCEEFLVRTGEGGRRHRAKALSVKEGYFAKEAKRNKVQE
jgi:hypothetical protein